MSVPRDEQCQVPGCQLEYTMTYLGKRVCQKCWEDNSSALLKQLLGIPQTPKEQLNAR